MCDDHSPTVLWRTGSGTGRLLWSRKFLERSFPAQSIHVGSARPIKKLLWHVLHLGRTPRRHTTCGHLLAEHQLELCRYPVTEYLGRYSRHIQLERAILSHHASKPFYPRSRKWVYVSGWCNPEPVLGTSVWHESPVLLHHQSRYTGRQTIGRQILCGARHTRSHHGVYQSGY